MKKPDFNINNPAHLITAYYVGKFFMSEKDRLVYVSRLEDYLTDFLDYFGFSKKGKEIIKLSNLPKLLGRTVKYAFTNPTIAPKVFLLLFVPILIFILWFLESFQFIPVKDAQGEQVYDTIEAHSREYFYNDTPTVIGNITLKQLAKAINETDYEFLTRVLNSNNISIEKFKDWCLTHQSDQIIEIPLKRALLPPFLHNIYLLLKSGIAWIFTDKNDLQEFFDDLGWNKLADRVQRLENSSWLFQLGSNFLGGIFNFFVDIYEYAEDEYLLTMDAIADSVNIENIDRYINFYLTGVLEDIEDIKDPDPTDPDPIPIDVVGDIFGTFTDIYSLKLNQLWVWWFKNDPASPYIGASGYLPINDNAVEREAAKQTEKNNVPAGWHWVEELKNFLNDQDFDIYTTNKMAEEFPDLENPLDGLVGDIDSPETNTDRELI